VAEYWSEHHGGTDAFSPLVYWLAVPEVQERFQRLSTGGQLASFARNPSTTRSGRYARPFASSVSTSMAVL